MLDVRAVGETAESQDREASYMPICLFPCSLMKPSVEREKIDIEREGRHSQSSGRERERLGMITLLLSLT